jgi:broad specificity phosphatase PhoE
LTKTFNLEYGYSIENNHQSKLTIDFMSLITLIRHGQASFGAENYDLLSDLGRQQAAAVGDYFAAQQISFDSIVHGKMSRQTETAQIMADSKKFVGELILDNGANEFDSDQLLNHYLPLLITENSALAAIIQSETPWYNCNRSFESIFCELIRLWQTDQECPFESWPQFKQRVLDFIIRVQQNYSTEKRIAIVTSGGVISALMQAILSFDDHVFMETCLTINNASLTELKIKSRQRTKVTANIRLVSFNNISPLLLKNKKELITRK